MFEFNLKVEMPEIPAPCMEGAPATQSGYAAAVLESLVKQHYGFKVTGDKTITAADPAGAAAQITAANLDTGSFAVGRDYYIFATVENGASSYAVSLDKSFDTSRLVGGFHYGMNRRIDDALQPINASGEVRGRGWEGNVYEGILPYSLWTLARRPKCDPEGMVQLPTGLWVDIYQASDDGAGGLASAFNVKPLTGHNWFDFNEMAMAKGKRLLSMAEWWQMALGSPQGLDDSNENAWTSEHNSGRQKTGYVANAVSSIGCRDAVGNVWEWMNEFTSDPDGGEWKWWDKMPGYGRIFMAGSTGLMALIGGGHWYNGAHAGARTVGLNSYPWSVYPDIGARCACDSL